MKSILPSITQTAAQTTPETPTSAEATKTPKSAKRKAAPKDPLKPKRAASAYTLFCKAMRDSVKTLNREAKPAYIMKLLGEQWRNVDVGDKKKYDDEAKEEKAKYEEAINDYNGKVARGEIVPPTPSDEPAEKPAKTPRKSAKKATKTADTPGTPATPGTTVSPTASGAQAGAQVPKIALPKSRKAVKPAPVPVPAAASPTPAKGQAQPAVVAPVSPPATPGFGGEQVDGGDEMAVDQEC